MEELLMRASQITGAPPESIMASRFGRPGHPERQFFVWLATEAGFTGRQLAEFFGVSRAAVSYLLTTAKTNDRLAAWKVAAQPDSC